MDAGFIDLDILLTRVRNAQSKIYFRDAVKAYKAGALRSSMTAVWVALVYDLIAKYRELKAMGDPAASAFITSWDNATTSRSIPKLLELERDILEDATANTQVINHIAHKHLMRLHEDRHLCAHPAFSTEAELFEPSPELVRLHLVNTVYLVLSQELLQGKAIFDIYDVDVQSSGFPVPHTRILDYVEQRYLDRVRVQNIRNFGTVLAKSLLKGLPAQWEQHQPKIISSLVAVRDRAPQAWQDLIPAIIRVIDTLEPKHRPRAIAFIASFPDFWPLLLEPTRVALQATVDNVDVDELADYRILAGVTFPLFRDPLLTIIATLNSVRLSEAISSQPLNELWPRAIELYRGSGSYRSSEENFRDLISPFVGVLDSDEFDLLFDAIIGNGQNWDASETDNLLLRLLQNTAAVDLPTPEARNRLYRHTTRMRRNEKYDDVFVFLQSDGWVLPEAELEPEPDN